MEKFEIQIKQYMRNEYGDAYDLGDVDACDTITANESTYSDALELALLRAGNWLSYDGGLVSVSDSKRGTVFYHRHGLTGEITKLASVDELRKHLLKKCNGMGLINASKK